MLQAPLRMWAAAGLALAVATQRPARGAPEVAPRLASAAWVATGLAYQRGTSVVATAALAGRLDPTWSTPWLYGALMARRSEAPRDALGLLTEGAAICSHDPSLPALLGSLLLADGDRAGAAAWYRRAAATPGVPADLATISAALDAQ